MIKRDRRGFSILAAVALLSAGFIVLTAMLSFFNAQHKQSNAFRVDFNKNMTLQNIEVALTDANFCKTSLFGAAPVTVIPTGTNKDFSMSVNSITVLGHTLAKPNDPYGDGKISASLSLVGNLASAVDNGDGTLSASAALGLTTNTKLQLKLVVEKTSLKLRSCAYKYSSIDDSDAQLSRLCKQLGGQYKPRSPADLNNKFCRLESRRFAGTLEYGESGSCETPNAVTGACKCPPAYSEVVGWRWQEELSNAYQFYDKVTVCWR